MGRTRHESWGRWIAAQPARVIDAAWPDFVPPDDDLVLPYGLGRSYGDVCLNNGHTLLATSRLSRFRAFDERTGVMQCEGGVTLADILAVSVARGWFLPVTPGTKFATVGGCIANDVHGKNHHRAGTFGMHVRSLELVRSDGKRFRCSLDENADLFRATVGGLGLTGLIVSAEIQLRPIESPAVAVEHLPFHSLEEFEALSRQSDAQFEYTVAWLDSFARPAIKGVFSRANHIGAPVSSPAHAAGDSGAPLGLLSPLLNPATVRAFNAMYFKRKLRRPRETAHYDPFFYPLDAVNDWNAIYGRHGFLQYQCVIPEAAGLSPVAEILDGAESFLTVIKKFGGHESPGLLSFPRAGTTVSLDFPARSPEVLLPLLERFDDIVEAAAGRVYPAKDARMSGARFRRFFPEWERLRNHADPQFSSSFWRRVTG